MYTCFGVYKPSAFCYISLFLSPSWAIKFIGEKMELELGLRITRTRETGGESTSTDLRIVKDSAGPIFLSRETEKMFILTAHLKGFRRERIKIEISEDGTRIAINGEKHVQEMVMMGWTMYKKEREVIGFRKVFQIPDGVFLDRIKARFDEEDAVLTITMPKSVKGIVGVGIKEVKEEEIEDKKPDETSRQTGATTETLVETKVERDPVVERSPRTPEKMGIEDESEEIVPTSIPELPAIRKSEQEREIAEELKSKPPDSPPLEETQQEATVEFQKQTTDEQFPEPDIKIPEQEPGQVMNEVYDQEVEPPEEQTKQETTNENEKLRRQEIEEEEAKGKQVEPPRVPETSDQQHHENSENAKEVEPDPLGSAASEYLEDDEIEHQRKKIEELENEIRELEKEMNRSKCDEEVERIDEESPDAAGSTAAETRTPVRRSLAFCGASIVAGSSLIGILLFLLMQLLQKRKKSKKR